MFPLNTGDLPRPSPPPARLHRQLVPAPRAAMSGSANCGDAPARLHDQVPEEQVEFVLEQVNGFAEAGKACLLVCWSRYQASSSACGRPATGAPCSSIVAPPLRSSSRRCITTRFCHPRPPQPHHAECAGKIRCILAMQQSAGCAPAPAGAPAASAAPCMPSPTTPEVLRIVMTRHACLLACTTRLCRAMHARP